MTAAPLTISAILAGVRGGDGGRARCFGFKGLAALVGCMAVDGAGRAVVAVLRVPGTVICGGMIGATLADDRGGVGMMTGRAGQGLSDRRGQGAGGAGDGRGQGGEKGRGRGGRFAGLAELAGLHAVEVAGRAMASVLAVFAGVNRAGVTGDGKAPGCICVAGVMGKAGGGAGVGMMSERAGGQGRGRGGRFAGLWKLVGLRAVESAGGVVAAVLDGLGMRQVNTSKVGGGRDVN